ncbi:MAG: hypothetical protein PQJ58_18920 [Spirochaetales bacterium]|nr:hypothetical protein [Spirochaetales bacterium]
MKRKKLIILGLIVLLVLLSCAAGVNSLKGTADSGGDIAGFWMGLWHGIASPIMFIISLFNKNISIYEIHNNGNWYNFGFLLGASIIFGGSGSGAGSRKCR